MRMRALKLGLLVSCAFLQTSCFLVAETAQKSIDAGRLTLNQTNMTTTGAVGGIVAGAVAGILLSPIANAIDEANIKALAFYCEMENPPDKKDYSNCIEWGKAHWKMAQEFDNTLRNGSCHNKFLGLSKGLIKCWDEAFDYAKNINSDVKEAVYRTNFEYIYAYCMPLRIESMNQEELYQKHIECKKKADRKATEFVNDVNYPPPIEAGLVEIQAQLISFSQRGITLSGYVMQEYIGTAGCSPSPAHCGQWLNIPEG